MVGPPRAVAALRSAVRPGLRRSPQPVLVACSGGADSVALAAALAFEARDAEVRVGGVTVDHGLQPGSADRAERTAALLRDLRLDPVIVLRVSVGPDGGPEGAARSARYDALAAAAEEHGARIALGHTLDDQAETVLLGLGRGSGPRSVAGMVEHRPPYWRPLLGVRRATTRAACADQGLPVWEDPWNDDPAYTRARLRAEVLPLLEDVLAGGVAEALARTAEQLREDTDLLDTLAADLLGTARAGDGLDCAVLAAAAVALRRRAVRAWLAERAVTGLTAEHLGAADRLVTGKRDGSGVALPGGCELHRAHGRLDVLPIGWPAGAPTTSRPTEGRQRVRR